MIQPTKHCTKQHHWLSQFHSAHPEPSGFLLEIEDLSNQERFWIGNVLFWRQGQADAQATAKDQCPDSFRHKQGIQIDFTLKKWLKRNDF